MAFSTPQHPMKTRDAADIRGEGILSAATVFILPICKSWAYLRSMIMPKPSLIFALAFWSITVSSPLRGRSPDAKPSYSPPQGVVPNQTTAVLIAEAVLTPIYGEEKVKHEEPFVVKLKNGSGPYTDEYGPNPAEIYMLKSQRRQDAFCEYTGLNKQFQSAVVVENEWAEYGLALTRPNDRRKRRYRRLVGEALFQEESFSRPDQPHRFH
jgi:hypothetical protein